MTQPLLIAIIGPTAAGKTDLGIALAKRVGGAVISADSRQVYAGLNIGSGKPREAWREEPHAAALPDQIDGIDHYLINIASPGKTISLASWQRAAHKALACIRRAGQTPLIVGGTMQYVSSLAENWQVPEVAPDERLREELSQLPNTELFRQLLAGDPDATTFIEPHNRRRIIRALEVMAATNQPFSRLRTKQPVPYNISLIGLCPSWEELEQSIAVRARHMFATGLLKETKKLRERFGTDLLAVTTNYRQALAVLDGKMSVEAAIADMTNADLRYTRRQMSWWRRRREIRWLDTVTYNIITALTAEYGGLRK